MDKSPRSSVSSQRLIRESTSVTERSTAFSSARAVQPLRGQPEPQSDQFICAHSFHLKLQVTAAAETLYEGNVWN